MKHRSAQNAGVSVPLMKTFGLSEAELETYYKLWARTNKTKFAAHFNSGESAYEPNTPTVIEKGGVYKTIVAPEGSYSSEIRAFKQKNDDPMILLLVPNGGFSSDLPGTQLVPLDGFEQFTKGVYIPALESGTIKSLRRNRNILEVTGVLNNAGDRNEYTIYVLDKTKPAACSEDKDSLILKFPDLSKAADARVIDGYQLIISTQVMI